jgi:glycosyltransferase involved in cell wall biosynthesis
MTVTYMGSVHSNPVYSPVTYFAAIKALPEHIRSGMETRFIGRVAREAESLLDGRWSTVTKLGAMPQADAIKQMQHTDYLLLIVNDPSAHAGKLFDYMASGIPILALTPQNGEIAKLIRETGTGWIADPADPNAVRSLLAHAWEHRNGEKSIIHPNWPAIQAFSWPSLVDKLVKETGIGESRKSLALSAPVTR